MIHFLAVTDTNSAAYQIGEVAGAVMAIALLFGVPIFFIVALIQYIRTKSKGWLVGMILSSIPLVLIIGAFAYGVFQGVQNHKLYTAEDQSIPEDRVVASVDELLEVQLPSHWNLLTDLNQIATLQAGNLFREEYLIALPTSKGDVISDLRTQTDGTVEHLQQTLNNFDIGDYKEFDLNGMPAIQYVVSGEMNNMRVHYKNTMIEGTDHFYQVLCWTLPSKKEKAFVVFDEVLGTIKEL